MHKHEGEIKPKTDTAAIADVLRDFIKITSFNVAQIATDAATLRCPNGVLDTAPGDMLNVVSFAGERVPSREVLAYALGIAVGAALDRDGELPRSYEDLVELITAASEDPNG